MRFLFTLFITGCILLLPLQGVAQNVDASGQTNRKCPKGGYRIVIHLTNGQQLNARLLERQVDHLTVCRNNTIQEITYDQIRILELKTSFWEKLHKFFYGENMQMVFDFITGAMVAAVPIGLVVLMLKTAH